MTDRDDPLRESAAQIAHAVAGDNDLQFALIFQATVNQAVGFADADDPVELATSVLNRGVGTRSISSSPTIEGLYADRTYLTNARTMAEDRLCIVGGAPTSDFPDCVAVGSASAWCCSGTVIAPNVVLTAAHCIVPEDCGRRVFVGDDVRHPDAGKIIEVTEAVVHPGYRGEGSPDDLAVLLLSRPVDVVPRKFAPIDAVNDHSSVRVVGFGRTNPAGTTGFGRRRQVDVALAGNEPGYGANQDTEFVAGAPFLDRDTCRGDSGGPAYLRIDDEWLLAGATSRATQSRYRPCGDGGIYTRVAVHERWIRSAADH